MSRTKINKPKAIRYSILTLIAFLVAVGGVFAYQKTLAQDASNDVYNLEVTPEKADLGQEVDLNFEFSADSENLTKVAVQTDHSGFDLGESPDVVCMVNSSDSNSAEKEAAEPISGIDNGYSCNYSNGVANVTMEFRNVEATSTTEEGFKAGGRDVNDEVYADTDFQKYVEIKELSATASVNPNTADTDQQRNYTFTLKNSDSDNADSLVGVNIDIPDDFTVSGVSSEVEGWNCEVKNRESRRIECSGEDSNPSPMDANSEGSMVATATAPSATGTYIWDTTILGSAGGSYTLPEEDSPQIEIQERPDLEVVSLSPRYASQGQTGITMEAEMKNQGEVKVTLNEDGSVLTFNDKTATITESVSISAGETETLSFESLDIASNTDPQAYNVTLDLVGEDNNEASYRDSIDAGSITVQEPADLTINSITSKEDAISNHSDATSSTIISASIENLGGATADITSKDLVLKNESGDTISGKFSISGESSVDKIPSSTSKNIRWKILADSGTNYEGAVKADISVEYNDDNTDQEAPHTPATSSQDGIFTVDSTTPTGGNIDYKDGWHTSDSVTVDVASGFDSLTGIRNVQLYKRVANYDESCESFGNWQEEGSQNVEDTQVDVSVDSDNCYQFKYEANDAAGNTATYDSDNIVKVDTVVPNVANMTVDYPGDQERAKNGDIVTVTADVSDETSGVASVELDPQKAGIVDTKDMTDENDDGTYMATVTASTSMADTQHTIDITALDHSGNKTIESSQNESERIVMDNTPPSIDSYTFNGQSQDVYFNPNEDGPVNINLQANESVDWISAKIYNSSDNEIYKNKYPDNDDTDSTSFTWDGSLSDGGSTATSGTYYLEVHIEDRAGHDEDNIKLEDHGIIVDTQSPEVTIESPSDGGIVRNSDSKVEVKYSASDENMSSCYYQVDNNSRNSLSSCDSPATIKITEDGWHQIKIIAEDGAQNSDSDSIDILMDSDSTLTVKKEGGDFESIQSAVDVAQEEDIVKVFNGIYNEQVEVDTPSIDLVSKNEYGATIKFAPEGVTGEPTVGISANGVTLSDFKIERVSHSDRSENSSHAQGVRVDAAGVTVENNKVIGDLGNTNNEYDRFDGIMVIDNDNSDVNDVDLINNQVEGFYGGIVITEYYSKSVSGVTLNNNTKIENNDYGLVLKTHQSGQQPNNITGEGNDFRGNSKKSIYLSNNETLQGYNVETFDPSEVSLDGPIYVEEGDSIQTAIKVAAENSEIEVGPGTYEENVVVNKSLTLKGAQSNIEPTISESRGSESTINGTHKNVVTINASDVTVKGFLVKANSGNELLSNSGKGAGIVVDSGVNNATITNNIVKDISDGDNDTSENATYGILTWGDPSHIDIKNNLVTDVEEFGISINDNSSDVAVEGNKVVNIQPASRDDNPPVELETSSVVPSEVGIALALGGSTTPQSISVEDNILETGLMDDNALGVGIAFDEYNFSGSNITVDHNQLAQNDYGVLSLSTSEVNADKNWWGSENGPNVEGNYQGDGVGIYGDVDYRPWCTDEDCSNVDENTPTIQDSSVVDPMSQQEKNRVVINPNDSKFTNDPTSISITASEEVTFKTYICSFDIGVSECNADTAVKTFDYQEGDNPFSGEWNGKDSSGNTATSGTYKIVTSITDQAGNQNKVEVDSEIVVDTNNPTIESYSQPAKNFYATTTIPIKFVANDNISNILGTFYELGTSIPNNICGQSIPPSPESTDNEDLPNIDSPNNDFSMAMDLSSSPNNYCNGENSIKINVQEGEKELAVSAIDEAYNRITSDPKIFIVDTTAPSTTVVEGVDENWTQEDEVKVEVEDENMNTATSATKYAFSQDDTCDSFDSYKKSFTSGKTFTIGGDHTEHLCIMARDDAGNTTYRNLGQLHTDNTEPEVNLLSTFEGQALSGNSVYSITWEASDENLGDKPVKLEYSVNGGDDWDPIVEETENDGSYDWITPEINTSQAQVRVTVTDEANNHGQNTGEEFTIIYKDDTKPADYCEENSDGTWTCDIELQEGWNLVSLPVIPSTTSVEALLGDLDMNMVKHYRASTSEWLSYSDETGDLTEIEDGKGYWIDMASSSTLSVTGVKMPAGIDHSPVYKVYRDWNLIGFKSVKYLKSSDYLQSLSGDDHILLNENNQKKNKDYMKPGNGYWLWMNQDGEIVTSNE